MYSPRHMFLLLSLLHSLLASEVETGCNQQLQFFYEQLGLPPNSTQLPAISFISGTANQLPFVTVVM
jgi:hypothetical protein